MSAQDTFHDAVKHGLEKDGWIITHDPLFIKFGGVDSYVDLGAEELVGAEKAGRKIAVEIKSFLGDSALTDYHSALGQFMNYRMVLEEKDAERVLFLAIPKDAYSGFFALPFAQISIQRNNLRLMVYDPVEEKIVKWIN